MRLARKPVESDVKVEEYSFQKTCGGSSVTTVQAAWRRGTKGNDTQCHWGKLEYWSKVGDTANGTS